LVTRESYVGSTIDLRKRLGEYFSLKFLKKEIVKNRSLINSSLLKYGYSNFSLDILEYCEPKLLVHREQYYIDTLDPEYNILKRVSLRLGVKYSTENLEKSKYRKLKKNN